MTRHNIVFRMDSVSPTGTRNPLTELETLHSLSQGDDRTSRRIPERHRLVEPVERGLRGVNHSLAAGFLDDLLDEIWTGPRFSHQILFGELDDHAFRSGGDQACFHFDQRLPVLWGRHGYIFDRGFPGFDVLKELFHFDSAQCRHFDRLNPSISANSIPRWRGIFDKHCNFILRSEASIPQEVAMI